MIFPDNTDDADQAVLQSLVKDESAMVEGYVVVVAWVDETGGRRWRCYTNSEMAVSSTIGLLEMAKLDILGRSDCGLPFAYEQDED